jgi:hypothetical protein
MVAFRIFNQVKILRIAAFEDELHAAVVGMQQDC